MPKPTAPPLRFLAHDRAEWRAWLLENHRDAAGVRVVFYKKRSGKPHLSYDEIVEEALCFGWIDSKPGKLDDERSMLYCTPRNPKSNWSGLNKARIARLTEAGLMTEQGQKMVEIAKKIGTWEALDEVEALVVPADLEAALAAAPPAAEHFSTFPRSVKRGILEWVRSAKTPETRQRRVAETAALAAENRRANQYVPKPIPPAPPQG